MPTANEIRGSRRASSSSSSTPSVNLNLKGSTMKSILKSAGKSVRSFAREDDGAQVVEYALIIAVVSIILVVALRNLTGTNFNGFISRVATCLTTSASCA
jgi:pilus assembly protein Flp/PilA